MRLSAIDSLCEGMTLGEPLHGPSGQLLLQRGVTLDARYITVLRKIGIPAVYIDDADTADIEIPAPVKPETRAKVLTNLNEVFKSISERSGTALQSSRDVAKQHLRSERFARPLQTVARDAGLNELLGDVDTLIEQALSNEVLVGLNSIKTHDNYTFQHSI